MNPDELAAHMCEVEARWSAFDPDAVRAAVTAASSPIRARWWEDMLSRGTHATSAGARVMWLRKEADARTGALRELTACAKLSCSHCCYQGVPIASAEARAIGAAIGVKPAKPSDRMTIGPAKRETDAGDYRARSAAMRAAYTGKACVFLADGRCSIYADRPIACRLHISFSPDDFLCRIVPGADIKVPYMDRRPENAAYAEAFVNDTHADVRDWFPRGKGR